MRNFKHLILTSIAAMTFIVSGAQETTKKETTHDWTKVINAIMQVESGGNPKAKSKESHEKSSSSSSSSSLNEISESNNSISSREKIDFLEGLSKGKQKAAFENLIKEEADRIDMINKQKKKLKNINLLENEIEGLYDWKTLFNHSRPISSYTKISKKTKKIEETKNDDFKFPVVLVDLPENEFKHYLQTTETPIPNKEKDKKNEKNILIDKKNEKKS